jgi:multidrug efflux pump subunit AcrB
MDTEPKHSVVSGIIDAFLKGNLAILLIIVALAAGAAALFLTPREEEPQIVVPLADVMVMYPGGSAQEVERLVSSRLERMLYQIDGVEYVYSMSRPGMAVVTVRFKVGEDREQSLIKLYNKIFQNIDKTTPGIAGWVVKPIEIDDVPIVNVALYSDRYDEHTLYRIGEEVVARLQRIPNTGDIQLHGGQRRVLHVYLDMERIAAYGLSPMEIAGALKVSNAQLESGSFEQGNASLRVIAGPFLRDVAEVRNLMVGTHANRPVYLRDVARLEDAPDEVRSYTRIGFGAGAMSTNDTPLAITASSSFPAVTIAIAKKKGSNAVSVSREVERSLTAMRGTTIPDEAHFRITRDYGETANAKVNNLVKSLVEAIITVIVLIAISMTLRVSLIVALTVPITYSLTLLINYFAGYTINRVTLFALILSLGLLVDDPIVAVENIYRHLSMRRYPRLKAISMAMKEVLPPVILATLAVVVAFIPLFFISGMMGPYMRPMALNVPLAMLASMLVSFAITPWLSSKLLRDDLTHDVYDVKQTRTFRLYSALLRPFAESRRNGKLLLAGTGALFVASLLLIPAGGVPLKMLPLDNKNEFQMLVDTPESATLETTDGVVRELEDYLRTIPEVTDFTSTVGAGSPMDFNGLVRHYYLRQGPNVADIRVNLLPQDSREMDSHSIILRIRHDIAAIGQRRNARIKLVEVPPGPPVLSTVVAEIYGQPHHTYRDLIDAAQLVKARMEQEPGVVDVDDTAEADQRELFFHVDREKAGLSGISTEDITQTLFLTLNGMPAGTLHVPGQQNEIPIVLRLPRERRSDVAYLKNIVVKGRGGHAVQLGELGRFEEATYDKTIFHKNLERVAYVTAETAGRGPAYAVLNLQSHFKKHPLPAGLTIDWRGEGEWKITLDVFRDLGIAFAAALVGIYVLLVYETRSYALPGVIMMSIPLTLIGILPGFWLLNLIVDKPVGGFGNPVFFTATAMIGMITLAGIVVRNGILLVDFIRTAVERGGDVREAVYEAGAVRFRPIFLTASTTMLGTWPITLDPIFSGLAWAIIFGLFVSTAFTLLVIPTVYVLIYGNQTVKAQVEETT